MIALSLVVCCAAIHCASHVTVRTNQHPNECVQQLSSLWNNPLLPHVCLRLHRGQVRQQVLADRALLCHRLNPLRLHRRFRFQS